MPDIVVPRGIAPFFLPGRPVRGRLIRLGPLADALLTRHDNHPAVAGSLGAGAGAGGRPGHGPEVPRLVQPAGQGRRPGPMLLADCTDTGALRGYARADADKLAALLAADPRPGRRLLGARLSRLHRRSGSRTRPPSGHRRDRRRHLADMALHYFRTCEQLRCLVHLACEPTPSGLARRRADPGKDCRAGGVDPDMPEPEQEESWRTATALAGTRHRCGAAGRRPAAGAAAVPAVPYRGRRRRPARALSYGCRCSRARLAGILEGFPPDDLDHMTVAGDIVMTCEFCNFDFRFPRHQVQGRVARH